PALGRFFLAASGLERHPDALAGVFFQTAELAVAADAVDVAVADEGRRHDSVKLIGLVGPLPFTALGPFALPEDGWLIVLQLEHGRAVVKRGEEEAVAVEAWGGNCQRRLQSPRMRP